MRKRTAYTLLGTTLIASALSFALYLRSKAPPEAARLLPEADAIVYLNLKPLRAATHFDRNPVAPSPTYQHFIDATGIVPERDLDHAAFALQRMPDPHGPNGPVAFSEVFIGRFNSERLAGFLGAQSTSNETYAGHIIFSLPSEARTLRITLLDYETIAASNTPTPEQLHSIIDRARAAASPFAGASLLTSHYADVPAFSSAWAIGQLGLPLLESGAGDGKENARLTLAGLELPIPADTTFIASLRYTSALHLRVDQLAASPSAAAQSAQALTNLLSLFRGLQQSPPPTPELTQFLDSISIQPHSDRATVTATIPPNLLKHLSSPRP